LADRPIEFETQGSVKHLNAAAISLGLQGFKPHSVIMGISYQVFTMGNSLGTVTL